MCADLWEKDVGAPVEGISMGYLHIHHFILQDLAEDEAEHLLAALCKMFVKRSGRRRCSTMSDLCSN